MASYYFLPFIIFLFFSNCLFNELYLFSYYFPFLVIHCKLYYCLFIIWLLFSYKRNHIVPRVSWFVTKLLWWKPVSHIAFMVSYFSLFLLLRFEYTTLFSVNNCERFHIWQALLWIKHQFRGFKGRTETALMG